MARSTKRRLNLAHGGDDSRPQPVSKQEYIRKSREMCRKGQCCNDPAMLDEAYEQYVNDPKAPWNKGRRRR